MKAILNKVIIMFVASMIFQSCSKEFDTGVDSDIQKEGTTIHNLVIDGNKTIIKEVNGVYYFSDHEVLSERQFNILKRLANNSLGTIERATVISDFVKKWTNGIWYYKIESSRASDIQTAMNMISGVSNVKFVERTNQSQYVSIYDIPTSDTVTSSQSNHVGMETGTTNKTILLQARQGVGTIAHEILHSLGFFHEQSRPDRDNYITVYDHLIPNDWKAQFNIAPGSQGIGPFDFNSIMAYGSQLGPNGPIVMVNKATNEPWLAQRFYLSDGDIAGLAAMYGAVITGPNSICTEEIYTVNTGVVSLENASGIATLTHLGGNQYKITRIGSANAVINIKSTIGNYSSTRKVNIGSPSPTISGGSPTVWSGNEYFYSVQKNDPNSTIDVLQAGGPGMPYKVEKYGDSGIKLTTYHIDSDVHDYLIRLRATETNACGTSGVTNFTVRFRGGVGPIQ